MNRVPPASMARESLRLHVEDSPAAYDVMWLDDHVAAFAVEATGHDDARPLAVFARDDGAQVGGIHGWTWGRCCELVALWVTEPMRGRGLGSRLLAAAEQEARARGCRQVVLFTHDVQAPRLYIRAGYEMVAELADFPAGSTAYWFRKGLDDLDPIIRFG